MSKRSVFCLILIAFGLVAVACSQKPASAPTSTVQPGARAEATPPPADQTSPPPLPNMLTQAEGEVWLRRAGWNDFLLAGFGISVAPGDLLRVAEGSAVAVFCGDESAWDNGPTPVLADGQEHGVPCQAGRPPRPWSDVAALRAQEDSHVPYVLRPRNTALLNDRPALGWHLLPDVDSYTVTLIGDDGQDRPPVQASGGELDWPEDWPPLEARATYVLIVEGGGLRSDGSGEGHAGLGFWLLPAAEAESVQALEARLRAQSFSATAADMLVAELYASHGLHAEAAQLLQNLTTSENVPAIWLGLGRVRLETGLASEAQEAFDQALSVAQAGGALETEAEALVGLGLAARHQDDAEAAEKHLRAARVLYEQIGDQDAVAQVDRLLAE